MDLRRMRGGQALRQEAEELTQALQELDEEILGMSQVSETGWREGGDGGMGQGRGQQEGQAVPPPLPVASGLLLLLRLPLSRLLPRQPLTPHVALMSPSCPPHAPLMSRSLIPLGICVRPPR